MHDVEEAIQQDLTEETAVIRACLSGRGWRRRSRLAEVGMLLVLLIGATAVLAALRAPPLVAALVVGGIVVTSVAQGAVYQRQMALYEQAIWQLLGRVRNIKGGQRRLAAWIRGASPAKSPVETPRGLADPLGPLQPRTIRNAPPLPKPTGYGIDSYWSDDVRIARHACAETSPSQSFVTHRR